MFNALDTATYYQNVQALFLVAHILGDGFFIYQLFHFSKIQDDELALFSPPTPKAKST